MILTESVRHKGSRRRPALVDAALTADSNRRAAVAAFDSVRSEQKGLGKQIGPLQGQLKKATDDSQRSELQQQVDVLMAKALRTRRCRQDDRTGAARGRRSR